MEPTLQIGDAGSSNGTSVNGRLLLPGETMTLALGGRVRFGSIEFTIYDAATVFEALSQALRELR